MNTPKSILLALVLCSCALLGNGCAVFSGKKSAAVSDRSTYRAGFLASTDGKTFHPLLELLELVEKIKPVCKAVDHEAQTKAQYLIDRTDRGTRFKLKDCESSNPTNCAHLEKCLAARPVPWLVRATGRSADTAGTIYNDWLGRCGGQIAVNFYYGPQALLPLERVGCAEPEHDKLDTAYEKLMVGHQDVSGSPLAALYIEALLRKWDELAFNDGKPAINK